VSLPTIEKVQKGFKEALEREFNAPGFFRNQKHYHICKSVLNNQPAEITNAWFEIHSFDWSVPHITEYIADKNCWLFESSFISSGLLRYEKEADKSIPESPGSIPYTFNLTFKAVGFFENYLKIEDYEIWNQEQKILQAHKKLIDKKFSELGLKELNIFEPSVKELFFQIFQINPPNNLNGSHIKIDFEIAILEIRYAVAELFINYPYLNYIRKEIPSFGIFSPYPSYHEYLYHMWLGICIERIYVFWERIGYFLYNFLKPKGISSSKISFSSIIQVLEKNKQFEKLTEGIHFKFLKKVQKEQLDKDSPQISISAIRHRIIHYQPNETNQTLLGAKNFVDRVNALDSSATLIAHEEKDKELAYYLKDRFFECHQGFNEMLLLLKEYYEL
jgi:hypothetical protein